MTTTLVRRAGVLALIAATATTLSGCAGVLGAKMTYNDTEKAKITDIVLSGGSGDVRITTAAVDETTIQRIIRRTTNPGESYHLSGSVLSLDTSCGLNCSVSYQIQTPPGVKVRGALDSGDIQLAGVADTDVQVSSGDMLITDATGPVKVRATSGDIQVLRAHGTVSAVATSGDIRAIDPAGAVTIRATSGDVEVRLAAPNSVTADVTSGDIDISVPEGSYNIIDRTRSGDTSLNGLTSDPSSKNVLDLKASSGDVNVDTTA
jgi:Putative adhesin